MAKSSLVSPPFTKEEWAEADMECLADSPLGEHLVDYLCLYTHAVLKQFLASPPTGGNARPSAK